MGGKAAFNPPKFSHLYYQLIKKGSPWIQARIPKTVNISCLEFLDSLSPSPFTYTQLTFNNKFI